jgi:hypothetical protein
LCVREEDPFTSSPKLLPLCVCLAIWEREEMGRNQSKNTTLECMVKNFKNGFNGDYGVNSTPNKPKVLL